MGDTASTASQDARAQAWYGRRPTEQATSKYRATLFATRHWTRRRWNNGRRKLVCFRSVSLILACLDSTAKTQKMCARVESSIIIRTPGHTHVANARTWTDRHACWGPRTPARSLTLTRHATNIGTEYSSTKGSSHDAIGRRARCCSHGELDRPQGVRRAHVLLQPGDGHVHVDTAC